MMTWHAWREIFENEKGSHTIHVAATPSRVASPFPPKSRSKAEDLLLLLLLLRPPSSCRHPSPPSLFCTIAIATFEKQEGEDRSRRAEFEGPLTTDRVPHCGFLSRQKQRKEKEKEKEEEKI
ncbi:hypothetical protein NL676_016631 [Syzygium grande]|nr:hypothetical protein NL676_016631 [Syzygium grande]